MTGDMQAILRSKSALRRKLAALPVGEKLTMLDALRERSVTLQNAACDAKCVPIARLAAAQAALESAN